MCRVNPIQNGSGGHQGRRGLKPAATMCLGVLCLFLLFPACSGSPGVEPEPLLVRKEVVFFASDRAGRRGPGLDTDVWVMNTDGSNPRQVTHFTEGDYWPSDVSPDGKTLLFYRLDDGTFISGIYLLDLTQQEAAPVRVPFSGLVSEGSFFPDGERFLFSGFVFSGGTSHQAQVIFDPRDSSLVQVSPEGVSAFWGRLSPDGSQLCYSVYQPNLGTTVYLSHIDGSNRRALTPEEYASHAYYCAFSPSGEEVLYARAGFDLTYGYHLIRQNLATGERRTIRKWKDTGDIDYYAFPSVDSAGARVYVRVNGGADPDSLSEIASVGLDGSGFRLLTQDRHLDDTPVVANAYVWE